MTAVRRRHGYAALLAATGGSPFVRYEIPPAQAEAWWEADGAIAVRRRRHRDGRVGYVLLGSDAGVETLVAQLVEIAASDGIPAGRPVGVSLPQHLEPVLHARYRIHPGGDWEWFWTTREPPAAAGEEAVVRLDDVARSADVVAFLVAHSPTADTAPGGGERWFAIEGEGGRLAAVTAYGSTVTGAPHLSSVAVDASLRGQGLGRRIVAAVTRIAVREHGVCTLGMYSDNTVARVLYRSLGYDNPYAWASRAVLPQGAATSEPPLVSQEAESAATSRGSPCQPREAPRAQSVRTRAARGPRRRPPPCAAPG